MHELPLPVAVRLSSSTFGQAVNVACLQVQDSVRKGIIGMANSNLEKEQLISEVKNHIAIVRYVTGSATGFVRKFLLTCSVLEIFLLARLFVHQSWMACILLVIRH